MSKSYKERLNEITTLIFDVDGVFTDGMVLVMPDGQFVRRMNSKDSYALQFAIKKGLRIAIITGGNSIAVRDGLHSLGVKHIFLQSRNKEQVFDTFVEKQGISASEILYMGDDIPDYRVMEKCGLATCPADAAEEIKSISDYISVKKGGHGCVRDIIEQTLKVQGKWFDEDALEW
jgi:3-deoxy-D-manno-octulosonate 8-phosphate phosphatase (KDO 8-P phosphatase)